MDAGQLLGGRTGGLPGQHRPGHDATEGITLRRGDGGARGQHRLLEEHQGQRSRLRGRKMNKLAPPQSWKAATTAPKRRAAEAVRPPSERLDSTTHADMAPRFGYDFGRIAISAPLPIGLQPK